MPFVTREYLYLCQSLANKDAYEYSNLLARKRPPFLDICDLRSTEAYAVLLPTVPIEIWSVGSASPAKLTKLGIQATADPATLARAPAPTLIHAFHTGSDAGERGGIPGYCVLVRIKSNETYSCRLWRLDRFQSALPAWERRSIAVGYSARQVQSTLSAWERRVDVAARGFRDATSSQPVRANSSSIQITSEWVAGFPSASRRAISAIASGRAAT